MKLEKVEIYKYKSILEEQIVNIEDKITTLVGMNESGKTIFLESLAKSNYFEKDDKFIFNKINDYPRNELKRYEKSGQIDRVITCFYSIDDELFKTISDEIGDKTIINRELSISVKYDNGKEVLMPTINFKKYLIYKMQSMDIEKNILTEIYKIDDFKGFKEYVSQIEIVELKTELTKIIQEIDKYKIQSWNKDFSSYVYVKWLQPNIPKFWYYDEYYELPSKININKLKAGQLINENDKTSKALFELADINISSLLQSENYEEYIAELEATSNEITKQLFEYWSSNKNLDVRFNIEQKGNEKILDIRIWNNKYKISLPLSNRSRGFNWFFSFIVWFSKIQADKKSNYILLLDEPGLSLHASAQEDLLRFLEDLSERYQIIFTTHSPFMIDSLNLNRVRTVLDSENGTKILDSIMENDQNTLFPLQAALGYDIAQNLFVSKQNLLVEGPADLLYLTAMSNYLESLGKENLNYNITIVPVGGLDKVATFISLLRSTKLKTVCLLDTFNDPKGKQRVEDLVKTKIIKESNVLTFDLFIENHKSADIEDLFTKKEFISLFNLSFPKLESLNHEEFTENMRIINQINKIIPKKRFNHYKPALQLSKIDIESLNLCEETILRFEKIFHTVNKLF